MNETQNIIYHTKYTNNNIRTHNKRNKNTKKYTKHTNNITNKYKQQ